ALSCAGQGLAAVRIDRHKGPQGAIASPRRAKADLAQGGCAGASMGAQPTGQTARRSGGTKQLRHTLEVTSRTAIRSTSGALCWMFLAGLPCAKLAQGRMLFWEPITTMSAQLGGKSAFL